MIKELLEKVTEMMNPHPVYLVGGAVRDYLMGNEPKDYDFCTSAKPDEVEMIVNSSGRRAYLVGKRFGTIGCKIEVDGKFYMVEITTFRTEKYEKGNRKPEVEYVKSIHEDLSRRDFTINAMAIRLTKGNIRVIDPFCGQEDLDKRIIRCVGNARRRFKEDPLRMLRAIRFKCRFHFLIDETTEKRITSGAINILNISKERWMMELDKILMSDFVIYGIDSLVKTGLMRYIIPELMLQENYNQNSEYHNYTLLEHTKIVVSKTPKDINLRWGALLHDIAKPFVRTENKKGYSNYIGHEVLGADMVLRISEHLKWSNERTETVVDMVTNHLNEDCQLRTYDNMGKINNSSSKGDNAKGDKHGI